MICFIGNRPVLQIGRQQVTSYGTDWLRDTIIRGAEAAERDDFPFVEDMLEGINHYLENKCPLRILSIEDLHARLRKMLGRIGCQSIADSLPLIAPPINLSLPNIAQEAGDCFELAFFNHLHAEIEDLRSHGAETLYFAGIKDCVKLLTRSRRWTKHCEKCYQEITLFLHTHGNISESGSRGITLKLDQFEKSIKRAA
ncbi:MAG: hypothetical protein ACSHX0_06455 [Akkermansiaceae bacterium]